MTMPRFHSFVLSAACLALATGPPVRAADPPLTESLKTNSLDFPARGALRMGFGATYLHGVEIPFSGLAGDLRQVGVLRADAGVSDNVVVQLRGIVRQDLRIDPSRSNPVPPAE